MKQLPNIKQQLSTLIGLPSISSTLDEYDMSNEAVINQLASWCESLGFNVDIQCVDAERKKFNMLATLGRGPGGLILSGHTDTVPCNIDKWNSDPFTPVFDHTLLTLMNLETNGFPLRMPRKSAHEQTALITQIRRVSDSASRLGAPGVGEGGSPEEGASCEASAFYHP
jgi:acetylornithine deacetylase